MKKKIQMTCFFVLKEGYKNIICLLNVSSNEYIYSLNLNVPHLLDIIFKDKCMNPRLYCIYTMKCTIHTGYRISFFLWVMLCVTFFCTDCCRCCWIIQNLFAKGWLPAHWKIVRILCLMLWKCCLACLYLSREHSIWDICVRL